MRMTKKVLLTRSCIIAGALVFLLSARGATILGPERYSKLLKSVKSDGKEYVDTGFLPTADMKFTIEFTMPKKVEKTSMGIFGCRTTASKNNISMGADPSIIFLDFNSSAYVTYRASSAYEAGVAYRAELSAAERRLVRISDGEVIAENTTPCPDKMDLQQTLWLFDFNTTAKPWPKQAVDISLLKIECGGKVIRQYVPCELNGTATLFEQVTGTYVEVTGEALVGGDPVPDSAPPSVEPLDKSADIGFNLSSLATGPLDVYALYGAFDWGLENPQTFIATKEAKDSKEAVMADLGFKLTNDMEIDLTFCLDTDDECKTNNHGIFGARAGASEKNISVLCCNNTLCIDFNDSDYAQYRVSYKDDGIHHTLLNARLSAKRRALWRVSDGKLLAENTTECPDTFETKANATLWGSGTLVVKRAPVSIYGLTIRKGGAVVHDYRPVVVNGVTNMLDCVTQTPVLTLPLDDFCAGTAIPSVVKACADVSSDGSYVAQIKRPRLVPETEYRFGLFAAGGAGKDYAVWGCAHPRTFTTGEQIVRGFTLLFR